MAHCLADANRQIRRMAEDHQAEKAKWAKKRRQLRQIIRDLVIDFGTITGGTRSLDVARKELGIKTRSPGQEE